jgi:type IV secretory pathway TrbD component
MTTNQGSPIHGYHVPILRGVWERITSFGALRVWSHAWAAICLFLGLLVLTYWGFTWTLGPLLLWIIGHGALVLLTQWNPRWDEMIQAQMSRRYKSRYDAG